MQDSNNDVHLGTGAAQDQVWHLLQISDALDREFGSALSEVVPTLGWQPVMSYRGWLQNSESECLIENPPLRVRKFPLQKGYARPPFSWLARIGMDITGRLQRQSKDPRLTPLICTTPYYAPVAELWPGPVAYYLTDLIAAYAGADPALVRRLDRRMCKAATVLCPNSSRLASYLTEDAGADPNKIEIVPNATREANVFSNLPTEPASLPADATDLKRPVAGVIGNMAGNINWAFIREAVERTPEFTWLFVGPTSMEIPDVQERENREAVMQLDGRVRFVGPKLYGELAGYARCFDVAVMPYFRREPTFSGSSTRFYEHLAACRPMVATRGFEELLHKEPLLKLVDTAEEASIALHDLRSKNFEDGQNRSRWLASQEGTWKKRALALKAALTDRWQIR